MVAMSLLRLAQTHGTVGLGQILELEARESGALSCSCRSSSRFFQPNAMSRLHAEPPTTGSSFRLPIAGEETSHMAVRLEGAREAATAVLYMHGFASSHSGTKAAFFRRGFRDLGVPFCSFDFQGHGDSGGSMRDLTLTRNLADVRRVRQHLRELGYPQCSALRLVDGRRHRLVVRGASSGRRGGDDLDLAGARDREVPARAGRRRLTPAAGNATARSSCSIPSRPENPKPPVRLLGPTPPSQQPRPKTRTDFWPPRSWAGA